MSWCARICATYAIGKAVTQTLLERANAILEACQPDIALRSLDAIHLAAAAQCASWPLCTNDARMRSAATHMGYPLAPVPGTSRPH